MKSNIFLRFFSQVVANLIALVGFSLGLFFLLSALASSLFIALQSPPPTLPPGDNILHIELKGKLTFYHDKQRFWENKVGLVQIKEVLDHAAKNPDIKGVLFSLDSLRAGWTDVQNLRQAVLTFRESGKPVIFHANIYNEKKLWLASSGDRTIVTPEGQVGPLGQSMRVLFYKGLIDKLGIDLMVCRAGEYKSATEPYTEYELTRESREQFSRLIQERHAIVARDLSKMMQIPDDLADLVEDFIDENSMMNASRAQRLGFVTDIAQASDKDSFFSACIYEKAHGIARPIAPEVDEAIQQKRAFNEKLYAPKKPPQASSSQASSPQAWPAPPPAPTHPPVARQLPAPSNAPQAQPTPAPRQPGPNTPSPSRPIAPIRQPGPQPMPPHRPHPGTQKPNTPSPNLPGRGRPRGVPYPPPHPGPPPPRAPRPSPPTQAPSSPSPNASLIVHALGGPVHDTGAFIPMSDTSSTPQEAAPFETTSFELVSFEEYLDICSQEKEDEDEDDSGGDQVRVVALQGDVTYKTGREHISVKATIARLKPLIDDDSVKAVVLVIDSPGGGTLAKAEIESVLKQLREKKPVVCCMQNFAASAAYSIAALCHEVVASEMTLTGSIGVFCMVPNLHVFFRDKLLITTDGVKTHPHSDLGDLARKPGHDDFEIYQALVDESYDAFAAHVAHYRNLSKEDVLYELGGGRVWLGSEAKANGLVDHVGLIDKAIASAMRLAKVAQSDCKVVYDNPPITFDELVVGLRKGISGYSPSWMALFTPVLSEEQALMEELEERSQMQAFWPYCYAL